MSDLSDSNFKDILNATDVSLENEIVDSGPEIQDVQPQTVNDTWSDDEPPPPVNVAASSTKKSLRLVNKVRKGSDKYSDFFGHQLNLIT